MCICVALWICLSSTFSLIIYLLAVHGSESPFFLGRASVNSTVNVEIFALIPVGDYRETSARGRVVLRMMNV